MLAGPAAGPTDDAKNAARPYLILAPWGENSHAVSIRFARQPLSSCGRSALNPGSFVALRINAREIE